MARRPQKRVDAAKLVGNLIKNEKFIKTIAARKVGKTVRKLAGQRRDKLTNERYAKQRTKGLSLNQIVATCDRTRRDNAIRDDVTIKTLKLSRDKQRISSQSLTYDRTTGPLKIRPHKHYVDIIPSAGGESVNVSFGRAKRLSVNCDCEDWLYRWEYAMAKRWGACNEVHFGNGEFPVDTNPSLAPGICKHLYILLRYIKMKGL